MQNIISRDAVKQKVIAIISEQMAVDADKLTEDLNMVVDLGVDSLDVVELIMEFEDTFDLNIPDERAGDISTIAQIIDYIYKELK